MNFRWTSKFLKRLGTDNEVRNKGDGENEFSNGENGPPVHTL